MEKLVLVVNPGSSSREYALYRGGQMLLNAYYEHKDTICQLTTQSASGEHSVELDVAVFAEALSHFITMSSQTLTITPATDVAGVGIRLVAPGRHFLEHKQLDEELYQYLQQNMERAPLHIGVELEQIDQLRAHLPDTSIYLISDSEFHKTLSHEARNYAIPSADADAHDVYRFGYHGISVKSVVHVLREEQRTNYRRVIVCHLGSGSSITAVRDWKSIETSMGYSPLEGLVMATRSGSIDVEAALELKKQMHMDDTQLVDYLNQKSGLLGLSGSSNDIRQLLDQEEAGDERASFALQAMVYRIQSHIGAYLAVLGGLDALVFTATVGERSAILRRRICESVSHLGIELDTFKNDATDTTQAVISSGASPVAIHVVPANEPAELARQTQHLLATR